MSRHAKSTRGFWLPHNYTQQLYPHQKHYRPVHHRWLSTTRQLVHTQAPPSAWAGGRCEILAYMLILQRFISAALASVCTTILVSSSGAHPLHAYPDIEHCTLDHTTAVLPQPMQISRAFHPGLTRYSAGHRGVDISSHPGSPVFAPASGVVGFVGTVAHRPFLSVDVPCGYRITVFPIQSSQREGDAVEAGQQIGVVGKAPLAAADACNNGACIHLGVRTSAGDYANPLDILGGERSSRLIANSLFTTPVSSP